VVQHVTELGPLRVALVSGGLKLGGSTTFLCNLGGELLRRGVSVKVFSFEHENPLGSDFQKLNVPVSCQDERRFLFEDRLRAVLKDMREFRPTAVLACLSAISFEVLRYVPAGVFRMGIVQSHDPGVYRMVRFYSSVLDSMGAVSKTIKETLEGMPEFRTTPVAYLPYGVPMPAVARATDVEANPLRIIYLGRLAQEQKRVRLFPKIFEQLLASGISFHWTIAGDGPEKEFLQSTMTSRASQTVSFAGKVSYNDVPQLLSQHDLFLLASDYEGLPLSLLEAMAWGLVPVVSDLTSGIREVVDDSTGRCVPLNGSEGYVQAILWLNERRPEMARLSQAARERVRRNFSVEAMTDRWLEVFGKSAKQPAGAWAGHWRIRAPLTAPNDLRFSWPARWLRRLALRLRAWNH
jgi:colanic acid/amylovoran biosynthesis glycosyltransferase